MLWGPHNGSLELREMPDGAVDLGGVFVYGEAAVLSDGGRDGRPKKEKIAPHAFNYRIETPSEHGGPKEIHLLVGHDFGQPVASVRSGTLKLEDTEEALKFTARVAPEMREVSYVKDALAAISTGLATGISPGFRLPPKRAVANVEKFEDEGHDPANGKHNAIIRTVLDALLYELSIVTRPAYPNAQIEARSWNPGTSESRVSLSGTLNRWRL